MAANRRRPPYARAVASSNAVFPEPGDPIRFTATTPWDAKCSRLCRAIVSFSPSKCLRTSTGTRSGSPQPQVSHMGRNSSRA